ncbi:MAG: hypothetical protein AB8H80_03155 [Planctomycetota bacterium]
MSTEPSELYPLCQLLADIERDGHVRVPARFDACEDGLLARLRAIDDVVRDDGPADLPELNLPAATWAVRRLHAACVALVHRDLAGATTLQEQVAAPLPRSAPTHPRSRAAAATPSLAEHYSVDLVFRHLPRLFELTRMQSATDPLLEAVYRLVQPWPLSAIGVGKPKHREPSPKALAQILAEPSLRLCYVDRILDYDEASALSHPTVAACVQSALGEHSGVASATIQRALGWNP